MPRVESPETYNPSMAELIRDLRDDLVSLLRQELALAKREMTWKITTLGRNAVFILAGALIGLYCLFFLFFALSNLVGTGLTALGLAEAMAGWLAPLLFGMLLGAGALFLALKGMKGMRKAKPVPEQTLATLKEDGDWLKGKVA